MRPLEVRLRSPDVQIDALFPQGTLARRRGIFVMPRTLFAGFLGHTVCKLGQPLGGIVPTDMPATRWDRGWA